MVASGSLAWANPKSNARVSEWYQSVCPVTVQDLLCDMFYAQTSPLANVAVRSSRTDSEVQNARAWILRGPEPLGFSGALCCLRMGVSSCDSMARV